jgi:hypothetical protein
LGSEDCDDDGDDKHEAREDASDDALAVATLCADLLASEAAKAHSLHNGMGDELVVIRGFASSLFGMNEDIIALMGDGIIMDDALVEHTG